jgi:preprotein translocase subunit YajC
MHQLLSHFLQATTSTTTAKSKSSGSSYVSLLVIVAIFVVGYFAFLRPRQQRMRQQQSATRQIGIGDEVVSAGGIFGRVVAMDADQVEVEVAPGVVMTFLRRAISARPQTGPNPGRAPEPADEPWDIPSSSHDNPQGTEEPPPGGPGDDRDNH